MNLLTYYYKIGTLPFSTLSALTDEEAIHVMNLLYDASADDAIWGRFRNPVTYLRDRRETERWLREEFISKGGRPRDEYPIYMMLGDCGLIDKKMTAEKLGKVQLPLAGFGEDDITFTFFDSMFSLQLGRDKPEEYYQPEYHGKVFTLSEMLLIIKDKGQPSGDWWGNIPDDYFPFIEAQVWNHMLLWDIYNKIK